MINLAFRIGIVGTSVFLLAAGPLRAQDLTETPPPPASTDAEPGSTEGETIAEEASALQKPVIVCDEPVFEFGEVDSSSSVTHTFVVRNDGDSLLVIGKVKPACGCTVANITSKNLAPGESAEISTKLSLKNKVGPQRKTIAVDSNDPTTPRLTLSMVGVSRTEVEVKPRRIYVANATKGEANEETITVTSNAESPLTIKNVSTENPNVTAELISETTGKEFTIVVRTAEALPKGQTHGRVRIETDSEKNPLLNVPFQYNVVGELAVAPNEIALVEQTGVKLSRNIVVRPGLVKVFKVTEVVPPVDTIESSVRDMAGNGYMIQLKNIAPSVDLDGKSLLIRTDVEGMEEITVPFRVIKRPGRS